MKTIVVFIGLFIVIFLLVVLVSYTIGIGGFGLTNVLDVTVSRTYVDVGGTKDDPESYYVVVTDKGSFEVDNGILLGIWNADDLFGQIKEGHKYRITTKGKRYQNWFMQELPYIIKADPI
jgi:hypothetical protein